MLWLIIKRGIPFGILPFKFYNMKNKLIIVLTVVSIIFAAMFIKSYSSYNSLSNKYSISMANNKAY